MFEDEPRAGVLPHFLHHFLGEVLTTVFAGWVVAVDELATGYAGYGPAMPGFLGEGAERAKPGPGGDFQGVPAFGQAVVELRGLRVGLGRID